jgi:transposase-like protein
MVAPSLLSFFFSMRRSPRKRASMVRVPEKSTVIRFFVAIASAAEKVRLVQETMQPGMSVSYVARRARVAPQPSVQLAQTHARRRAAGGAGRRGCGWHETADLEDRQAVEQPDRSVAAYIAPEQVVVAVPLKSRCPTPTSPVTRRNRRPAESCRRS